MKLCSKHMDRFCVNAKVGSGGAALSSEVHQVPGLCKSNVAPRLVRLLRPKAVALRPWYHNVLESPVQRGRPFCEVQ